ncbi:hypothetical protein [Bartonella sp. B17]
MALFSFSIADIDNHEHIRVALYVNDKLGHVPLNALLKKIHKDISSLDKKQTKNITQISQRLETLEQQLKTFF